MIIKTRLVVLFELFLSFNRNALGESLLRLSSPEDDTIIVPCDSDEQCKDYHNAPCMEHFCWCNGSRNCEERRRGLVNKIGEICAIDEDCNIEHAACEARACRCVKDRVVADDKRKCLKVAAGLGSTCEHNIQCTSAVAEAICLDGTCRCQSRMHDYNGTCYNTVGLGQSCHHQGECSSTTFSECHENKCRCRDGYVRATGKCLQLGLKVGAPCYEDVQCTEKLGRARCKDGHCKCEELYQYKRSKAMCVRDLLLDETCENHTDCHGLEPGERRLECILGQCKCKSEYTEESGYCTSAGIRYSSLVEATLMVTFLLSLFFFPDSDAILWMGLGLTIFYMFWVTVLGKLFDNNNYMWNRPGED